MNLSLFKCIWLSIIGITVAAVAAMYVSLNASLLTVIDRAQTGQIKEYDRLLNDRIQQETRLAASLAALVAAQPSAQKALAEGDRAALAAEFLPAFQKLKTDAGASQFQFHLPPATSFLRLHEPETFGDDLSGSRAMLVDANAKRQAFGGIETGATGLGIRAVAPVAKNGAHIGTVEFGMKFDDTFFSAFKRDIGTDAVFQVADGKGGYVTFADTRADKTPLPADILPLVIGGQTDLREMPQGGKPAALYSRPVADYSGKTIGAVTVIMDTSAFDAERTAATRKSLLIAGAVFALATLISMKVAASIVKPIRSMVEALQTLAQGSTEVEVPYRDRKNEIGSIAQAIEVWRQNAIKRKHLKEEADRERLVREKRAQTIAALTQSFDAKVSGVLTVVADACAQMDATAQALSASAEQTSQQSGAVAAATEQASASVQTVASAAEELSASIAEIARQVAQSNDASQEAMNEAGQAETTVKGLAESSEQINAVVNLINDIASQTNLLALNATIEAARAGDAGKGFAVVANEVKNLASQTAKATDEISQQIASVQQSTERVVEAIGRIVTRITEVGQVSAQIAAAVEQQAAAANEIARNVQEASAGTREISTNIAGVSQAAGQTGEASRQVLAASQTLGGEANALKSVVEEFLEKVRAN
jgi:methyl-accepting chemotaxis protein